MFDEPEILYGGGAHLDLSIPDLYVLKCGPHQGGHAGSYMSGSIIAVMLENIIIPRLS